MVWAQLGYPIQYGKVESKRINNFYGKTLQVHAFVCVLTNENKKFKNSKLQIFVRTQTSARELLQKTGKPKTELSRQSKK